MPDILMLSKATGWGYRAKKTIFYEPVKRNVKHGLMKCRYEGEKPVHRKTFAVPGNKGMIYGGLHFIIAENPPDGNRSMIR